MTKANTTKTTSVEKFADVYEYYNFSEGDSVIVNWIKGQGPWDEISGTVDELDSFQALNREKPVISVTDHDDPDWENGRSYGCAPEWIVIDD